MEKRVLLIADSDPALRQKLAALLTARYWVHCCDTGTEALTLLRKIRPHVLVLELMLPELDGLGLMQTLTPEERPDVVLGLALTMNDYLSDATRRLGINYTMRRPCDAEAVAMRVDDLCSWAYETDGSRSPAGILESLGFVKSHSGSRFLIPAITMEAENPGQPLTKVVYPQVGKQEQATGQKVEKDIRYAIGKAWERSGREVWRRYFPCEEKPPSNGEFIAVMAELLAAQTKRYQ